MFDAPADITAGGDLAARRAARRKRNSVHVSAPAKYAAPDAYYELKQLLGQGAFAEVWRAQDKVADRKMAVKLYKKRSLKHDHIQMLVQQEIDVMRSLNSGNCIKLLDVHDTYRGRHLVMEYATGGSLFAYARKMKYLDEEECKEVFRQVARGLKALHDAGACHRDIKMENILFGHDKLLKLADFGLAAMVGDPEKKFNDVCGSLLYMAPEILQKKRYYGRPVDIWSMGVLLYVLLCGDFPFWGCSEADVIRVISTGKPPFPDMIGEGARALMLRMLAKNPADRCTIDEVLADPWLAGGSAVSKPFKKSRRRARDTGPVVSAKERANWVDPADVGAQDEIKARKRAEARRASRRASLDPSALQRRDRNRDRDHGDDSTRGSGERRGSAAAASRRRRASTSNVAPITATRVSALPKPAGAGAGATSAAPAASAASAAAAAAGVSHGASTRDRSRRRAPASAPHHADKAAARAAPSATAAAGRARARGVEPRPANASARHSTSSGTGSGRAAQTRQASSQSAPDTPVTAGIESARERAQRRAAKRLSEKVRFMPGRAALYRAPSKKAVLPELNSGSGSGAGGGSSNSLPSYLQPTANSRRKQDVPFRRARRTSAPAATLAPPVEQLRPSLNSINEAPGTRGNGPSSPAVALGESVMPRRHHGSGRGDNADGLDLLASPRSSRRPPSPLLSPGLSPALSRHSLVTPRSGASGTPTSRPSSARRRVELQPLSGPTPHSGALSSGDTSDPLLRPLPKKRPMSAKRRVLGAPSPHTPAKLATDGARPRLKRRMSRKELVQEVSEAAAASAAAGKVVSPSELFGRSSSGQQGGGASAKAFSPHTPRSLSRFKSSPSLLGNRGKRGRRGSAGASGGPRASAKGLRRHTSFRQRRHKDWIASAVERYEAIAVQLASGADVENIFASPTSSPVRKGSPSSAVSSNSPSEPASSPRGTRPSVLARAGRAAMSGGSGSGSGGGSLSRAETWDTAQFATVKRAARRRKESPTAAAGAAGTGMGAIHE